MKRAEEEEENGGGEGATAHGTGISEGGERL